MNDNPAWQSFLDVIPEDLHEKVTPLLEEWDKGVQSKFEKYKPYEEILAAGVDPEDLKQGVSMINALIDDPRRVYDTLGEYYKFASPTPEPSKKKEGEEEEPELDPSQQKIDQLQRQLEMIADHVLSDRKEKLQRQADQELDNELNNLRDTNKDKGEFDERYVLGLMSQGFRGQDAVDEFYKLRDRLVPKQPKPFIMGPGGLTPSSTVDPRKLSDGDARKYAVQMLENINAARRE